MAPLNMLPFPFAASGSAGVTVGYGRTWKAPRATDIATIGVGYLYLESDKYPCENCGTRIENTRKHYFGPTQAAVSAIYLF